MSREIRNNLFGIPSIDNRTVTSTSYEDLTTYTEVDNESNFTVTATKLTVVDMHTEHVTAYLYKDYTVGYFTKDFEIQFEFVVTDATHGQDDSDMYGIIAFQNTLGIRADVAPGPVVYWTPSVDGSKIEIHCGDASYAVSHVVFNSSPTTVFYCTLTRVAGVPAVTDAQVWIDVYSDSARTVRMNNVSGNPSIQYGRDDIPTITGNVAYKYVQLGTSERAADDPTTYGSYYVQNVEIVSNS